MSLLRLPNELLITIAEFVGGFEDLFAFHYANRRLSELLIPVVYKAALQGTRGWNSLYYTVFLRQKGKVRWLLKHGIDPNVVETRTDRTPLEEAIYYGSDDLVDMLIDNGASVNQVFSNGQRPVHYAVQREDTSLLHSLLEKGVDTKVRTWYGATPFIMACSGGFVKSAQMLLDYGVDVGVADDRWTTIHHVTKDAAGDIVCFLLSRGVETTPCCNQKNSAHVAAMESSGPTVKLLLDGETDASMEGKE